ncbi:hypothetical protein DEV91_111153 [Phyllobacterium brassicacearum]|nr:hypothetical protein DEV91_111153 [Phyllobacterium brassicacearum]
MGDLSNHVNCKNNIMTILMIVLNFQAKRLNREQQMFLISTQQICNDAKSGP